jgi:hypothetical protein
LLGKNQARSSRTQSSLKKNARWPISANLVLKIAAENQNEVEAVPSFSPGEYHPDTPDELRSAIGALRIPVLIASGVDEENTSKPIFDALPPGSKQYYLAVGGRHGSSILLDDPANWSGIEPVLESFGREKINPYDKQIREIMGSISLQTGKLSEFLANNLGGASRVDEYSICSDLPPYSKLLDSFQYRGISCWW